MITLKLLPSGRYIAYGEDATLVRRWLGQPEEATSPCVIHRLQNVHKVLTTAVRTGHSVQIVEG